MWAFFAGVLQAFTFMFVASFLAIALGVPQHAPPGEFDCADVGLLALLMWAGFANQRAS